MDGARPLGAASSAPTIFVRRHGCRDQPLTKDALMDVIAFTTGLVTGLGFTLLLLQRLYVARADVNAARALERDAHTELVVARERHATELETLQKELAGTDAAHNADLSGVRERFAIELAGLRRAVGDARAETLRAQDIEQLVLRVTQSVERVERELRRTGRGRHRPGQQREYAGAR